MKGTLTTLVDFNGTNGSQPNTGNLIAQVAAQLPGRRRRAGSHQQAIRMTAFASVFW